MTSVNMIGNSNASLIILEAMCDRAGPDDPFLKTFGIDDSHRGHVDVSMQINGVDVDVIETLNDVAKIMEGNFAERVMEKAKELVSRAKLDGVAEALERAEWEIEDALRKALPETGR